MDYTDLALRKRTGGVVGSCERSNEPSRSVK